MDMSHLPTLTHKRTGYQNTPAPVGNSLQLETHLPGGNLGSCAISHQTHTKHTTYNLSATFTLSKLLVKHLSVARPRPPGVIER